MDLADIGAPTAHTSSDALTGTVSAEHHQSLRVWVLCLYSMGLASFRSRLQPFG
jgi:hypothetical protein